MSSGAEASGTGPPRVSVIIPVRNRRDLLCRTLDALAEQTITDHEVIVIDDGSTDASGEAVIERAAIDGRVRLVTIHGEGAVAARTVGVGYSTAPILAFTDSDCTPDPRWLEVGVAAIDAGADVVQGLTRPERPVRPLERSVRSLTDDGLFATCNVFYRRQAFEDAGGFDGRAGDRLGFRPGSRLRGYGFGEDTLIGWRVRRSGVAVFAADAVVEHAVLAPDIPDALSRAWTIGAFPGLIREVPELRPLLAESLRSGLRRRLPIYGVFVSVLLRRPSLIAASFGLWLTSQWVEMAQAEPSRRRRIRALPLQMCVEATQAIALLWGSARARTRVL